MFSDTIKQQFWKSYEEILEKALEPYGINRQNIEENAHRVTIYQHESMSSTFQVVSDFYIDKEYAFSIKQVLRREDITPGATFMMVDTEIVKGENSND